VKGEVLVRGLHRHQRQVRSSIRARGRSKLYAPSKVWDPLHAPAIFIDRGVQLFDGSVQDGAARRRQRS
jgi:hypothetical protein